VALDADPVAEAVRELRVAGREAALDDLRARGAVDVAAGDARSDGLEGGELRVAHRVPRALDLGGGRAVEDPRPRFVALVAEEVAARVDEEDGSALERRSSGSPCGSAAAGPRRERFQLPAKPSFRCARSTIAEIARPGHPRLEAARGGQDRPLRELVRAPEQRDLVGVLAAAEPEEDPEAGAAVDRSRPNALREALGEGRSAARARSRCWRPRAARARRRAGGRGTRPPARRRSRRPGRASRGPLDLELRAARLERGRDPEVRAVGEDDETEEALRLPQESPAR
jgi:hypothetical protein